jgi:hypothetical protein
MNTSSPVSKLQTNGERLQEDRSTMPFAENRYSRFRFERECIRRNAPEASGVYGLFSAFWIYIGEAENLRAQILKQLDGHDPCVVRFQPSGFAFELISPEDRGRRLEYLTRRLQPLCNGKAACLKSDL